MGGGKSGGGMDPATIILLVYIKEFLVLQGRFLVPSWFQLSGVYFYLPQILSYSYLNKRII